MEENGSNKRKQKTGLICILILLVFFVAGIGIYALSSGYVRNQLRLLFLSPKEYYLKNAKNDMGRWLQDGFLLQDGLHAVLLVDQELAAASGMPEYQEIDFFLFRDRADAADLYRLTAYNNGLQILSADYFEIDGRHYLKSRNAYEGFIELPEGFGGITTVLGAFLHLEESRLAEQLFLVLDHVDGMPDDTAGHILKKLSGFITEQYRSLTAEQFQIHKSDRFFDGQTELACNTVQIEYSLKEAYQMFDAALQNLYMDELFLQEPKESMEELRGLLYELQLSIRDAAERNQDAGTILEHCYISRDGQFLYRDFAVTVPLQDFLQDMDIVVQAGYGLGHEAFYPEIFIRNAQKTVFTAAILPAGQRVFFDVFPNEENTAKLEEALQYFDESSVLGNLLRQESIQNMQEAGNEPENEDEQDHADEPEPTAVSNTEDEEDEDEELAGTDQPVINVPGDGDGQAEQENAGNAPPAKPPVFDGTKIQDQDTEYLHLGSYKGLRLAKAAKEVTEADLDAYIATYMSQYAGLKKTGQPAKKGDTLIIDYLISVDGSYTISETNGEFVLGDGLFDNTLEELFYNAAEMQTITSPYVLPAKYGDRAGEIGIFTAEVKGIYQYALPELDDAFVEEHFDFSTVEEYRNYLKESLEQIRAEEVEANLLSRIISRILEGSDILLYPSAEIEAYQEELAAYYKEFAAYHQMTEQELAETVFQMTLETFYLYLKKTAEEAVLYEMVLNAVIEEEGFTVEESQIEAILQLYTEEYQFESVEDLLNNYTVEEMERTYLYDKARTFLIENTIVE